MPINWFHKILFAHVTGTSKGVLWNYNDVDYYDDGNNNILNICTLKTMFYWTLILSWYAIFKTLVITEIVTYIFIVIIIIVRYYL